MSAGWRPVVMPARAPDDRVYLTTAQAAEEFGVTQDCIRRWRKLGYLKPAVTSSRGRSLWEFGALARAELLARDAAIATSGSDKRVRRNLAA